MFEKFENLGSLFPNFLFKKRFSLLTKPLIFKQEMIWWWKNGIHARIQKKGNNLRQYSVSQYKLWRNIPFLRLVKFNRNLFFTAWTKATQDFSLFERFIKTERSLSEQGTCPIFAVWKHLTTFSDARQ